MKILIVGGVSPTRRKCVIATRLLNLEVVLAAEGHNVPWASTNEAPQMAACIVRSSNENSKQAEMLVRMRFPSVPILTLFENDARCFTRDPESATLIRMGSAQASFASIKKMLSELLSAARKALADDVCRMDEATRQGE